MGFNISYIINDVVAVKNSKSLGTAITLHSNANTAEDGATIDVSGFTTLFLRSDGYYYDFIVKASKDNTNWIQLPVFRCDTQEFAVEARVNAVYAVDVSGFAKVKCPTIHGCLKLTLTAWGSSDKFNFDCKLVEQCKKPLVTRPESETKQNAYFTFCTDIYSVDENTEICYGIAGNAVNASDQYGGNLLNGANIKSFGSGTVTNFVKRIGDTLLVGVEKSAGGGELWLSDGLTTSANWTKVLETAVETGVHFSMYFGQDFYNNLCLVGEYGSRDKNRNVYMSLDSGATWTTILTIPSDESVGAHIHDVKFDRYGGIIWVTTGDGINAQNIYWSMDFGKTWKTMWSESGKCPAQFTTIMPLPNCILFASDTTQNMSVYRINRDELKDDGIPTIECAFVRFPDYNEESPFGTQAAIDYANGAVYFGFQERYDVVKTMPTIYGTNDGYNFFVMWQDSAFPTQIANSTTYACVNRMAISQNGTVVATLRNNTNQVTNGTQTVHFTAPQWN